MEGEGGDGHARVLHHVYGGGDAIFAGRGGSIEAGADPALYKAGVGGGEGGGWGGQGAGLLALVAGALFPLNHTQAREGEGRRDDHHVERLIFALLLVPLCSDEPAV